MDRPKENGIMKIGSTLTRLSMKYMPDPSIFAVVLTFIAFLLGVFVANVSPMQMVVNCGIRVFGACFPLQCRWL